MPRHAREPTVSWSHPSIAAKSSLVALIELSLTCQATRWVGQDSSTTGLYKAYRKRDAAGPCHVELSRVSVWATSIRLVGLVGIMIRTRR